MTGRTVQYLPLCEFVVLARELDVKLVTADAAVLDAFPDTATAPGRFAAG